MSAVVYVVQFEFQKFSAVRTPHLGDGPHHFPDDDDEGQDDQRWIFAVEGILWGRIMSAPEKNGESDKERDVANSPVDFRIFHFHSVFFKDCQFLVLQMMRCVVR